LPDATHLPCAVNEEGVDRTYGVQLGRKPRKRQRPSGARRVQPLQSLGASAGTLLCSL
jgi:hypothetical protein